MIPLHTTTIAIYRPRAGEDPYDRDPSDLGQKIASGVRAVISAPSGTDRSIGGDQSIITARLDADPCDLRHEDAVKDETLGCAYDVVWTRLRNGLGLDHVESGLREIVGASNA